MGRFGGGHRAQLRDRDLKVRQNLQQVCLEGLVGAVEFVDEEDGGDAVGRVESGEQGAPDEEVLGKDVAGEVGGRVVGVGARSIGRTGARTRCPAAVPLRSPDMDHLLRVVPLVHGRCQIQSLVALQPNERTAESRRQRLCHLGLADARLALQQQRPAQFERQEKGRAQTHVGHVTLAAQQCDGVVDGRGATPRGLRTAGHVALHPARGARPVWDGIGALITPIVLRVAADRTTISP